MMNLLLCNTIMLEESCAHSIQFHDQSIVDLKKRKKYLTSVKFCDPRLHRVICDSCINDSCYNELLLYRSLSDRAYKNEHNKTHGIRTQNAYTVT